MKNQIPEHLCAAVARAIHEHHPVSELKQAELMQAGEMLGLGRVDLVGHRHEQHAAGVQQARRRLERCFGRRRGVLEDLACDHEIVQSGFMHGRARDVEARRAVVERVAVVELRRERFGIGARVACAQPAQAFYPRKIRERQTEPEQFEGEGVNQAPRADTGAAGNATGAFATRFFAQPAALLSADIADKLGHRS